LLTSHVDLRWGPDHLPPDILTTSARTAQRDLFLYLTAYAEQATSLTLEGLVPKRHLRTINDALVNPDPRLHHASDEREAPKLHYLRCLAQSLGLLTRRSGTLKASNSVQAEFWQRPIDCRLRRCVEAWFTVQPWTELASVGLSSLDLDLPRARTDLLDQLRALPVEEWLSADRFKQHMEVLAPDLLLRVRNGTQRIAASRTQVHGSPDRIKQIRASFLSSALTGPLHWLGLVDLAMDSDSLMAFRLSATGSTVWADSDQVPCTADDQGVLVVQPDFQILAIGPVPEWFFFMLERFAARRRADTHTFEYFLTRDTVQKAQSNGLSVSEMIAFLTEHSSEAVPDNVLASLQEWGRRQERVTLHRNVALCHTGDPETLDALLVDSAVRVHIQRRLGPTIALLKRRRAAALRGLLFRQGHLPVVSTGPQACRECVRVDQAGQLIRLYGGPNLLLHSCLAPISEQREGNYYVTQGAVSAAMASGMTVEEYLARLARVHRGPVASQLLNQIRTWAGEMASAHLREALVLEFEDSQLASRLLDDPQLAGRLERFEPDPTGRSLLVRASDLEALRALLREKNVLVR